MAEVADSGSKAWPPLAAASRIFDVSSFVLTGSLIVGAVATICIVWMGIVKEHHWDALRERSQNAIASLNAQTAEAKSETARANEKISELAVQADQLRKDTAEANARTKEAELALVRFRAPRLGPDQREEKLTALTDQIKSFAGTKFDVGHGLEDREQWNFLWYLEPAISKAGWMHVDWDGGVKFKKNSWPGDHWYGRAAVLNVSIEVHNDGLKPAAVALADALNSIGIEATLGDLNNSSTNYDAIHLLVGPKR